METKTQGKLSELWLPMHRTNQVYFLQENCQFKLRERPAFKSLRYIPVAMILPLALGARKGLFLFLSNFGHDLLTLKGPKM